MIKKQKDISSENLESQKYLELQEAQNEEDRIMDEITKVFSSISDRTEAEKVVLEKWVPLMDEARKKTAEAMSIWRKSITGISGNKDEELDIMKRGLDM